MMKKLLFGLALAALTPSLSQAQGKMEMSKMPVKIDMSKITCEQMLAMSPDRQDDFAEFMSGWFAQKSGRTFIDMGLFKKNAASVHDWCASNKSETVMAGMQRAYAK